MRSFWKIFPDKTYIWYLAIVIKIIVSALKASHKTLFFLWNSVSFCCNHNDKFSSSKDEQYIYLSCNVKKVGKLIRFKQKGQKQASFLAFHKCCQGCLLRGPRYISTSFILVCALHCIIATGYQESLFVGWKVYSSSTNKAKIYS